VIIQDSLKQIGIEVTIETLDTASINDRLFNLDFEASLNFVGSLVDEADLLTKYCFDYDYGLLSCFSGNANTSETEALVSATQLGQSDEALRAAADDVTEYFLETMPFVNLADYAITGVARADVAPYFSIGRTLQMQIAALKP
jgi:ABC-type transport system substrate-binding protein